MVNYVSHTIRSRTPVCGTAPWGEPVLMAWRMAEVEVQKALDGKVSRNLSLVCFVY
jgi:hypothetical protein